MGGNPETGPFYLTGAMPGDMLVVHIMRLKLNRDWASSDDEVDERATNSGACGADQGFGQDGCGGSWIVRRARLGGEAGRAYESIHGSAEADAGMHGDGAWRQRSGAAAEAGDSGGYGGNMDFNEIGEGATVYLPVSNPGGVACISGMRHAAQGDGELNGNALETSMDVTVTVDVIPNKRIGFPRVENATEIITMGLDGSIDGAFKEATNDMATWLGEDYKLTPSEIAQVMGTAAEYHVSEVADRNAGVVLKIQQRAVDWVGEVG